MLTSDDLDGTAIQLNGTELVSNDDGTLPDMEGEQIDKAAEVPPASVAFVVNPDATGCT